MGVAVPLVFRARLLMSTGEVSGIDATHALPFSTVISVWVSATAAQSSGNRPFASVM